jgi:hypothetical protein
MMLSTPTRIFAGVLDSIPACCDEDDELDVRELFEDDPPPPCEEPPPPFDAPPLFVCHGMVYNVWVHFRNPFEHKIPAL